MTDIFISYRRQGGEYLAARLADHLRRRGLAVFQDIDSLRAGRFDVQTFDHLQRASSTVVVLTRDALAEAPGGNWMIREVSEALRLRKQIVLVLSTDFEFPTELPAGIDEITMYEGLRAVSEYFDSVVDRLLRLLEVPGSGEAEPGRVVSMAMRPQPSVRSALPMAAPPVGSKLAERLSSHRRATSGQSGSRLLPAYESPWMEEILSQPGTRGEHFVMSAADLTGAGFDVDPYKLVVAEKISRSEEEAGRVAEMLDYFFNNWRVILDEEGRIAGYWALAALSEDSFAEVMAGGVDEKDISLERAVFADFPGEYCGYILLSGVLQRSRTPGLVSMLYESLVGFIADLADDGIRFSRIGSMVSTPMGIAGMRNLGLREVGEYDLGGKMFAVDMGMIPADSFLGRDERIRRHYEIGTEAQ